VSESTSEPLFTIVTVCLDAGEHVSEALASVVEQSFGDYEYVVVDGGSVDGTHAVLQHYEKRFAGKMRWIAEPDEGLYFAMNKALGLARGTYVVFVGADDRLARDALSAVARVVTRQSPPDIVAGSVHVFGPHGSWDEAPHDYRKPGKLAKRAPARHQSIFVRRERILAAGGFNTQFRIAADYDLYLRLVEAGASQELIPDMLSEFRLGGVSSTNALATAKDYRDVRLEHDATRWVEQVVMVKSALAATLVGEWKRLTHRPGRV